MIKALTHPQKGQVVVFSILLMPLVLGIMALVIETGNMYVYYSELQHTADIAVVTCDETAAKNVIAKNNTINIKPDNPVKINLYCKTLSEYPDCFFIKLEKDVTPLIKVFGETKLPLKVYAAASRSEKKLVSFPTNPKNINWGDPVAD